MSIPIDAVDVKGMAQVSLLWLQEHGYKSAGDALTVLLRSQSLEEIRLEAQVDLVHETMNAPLGRFTHLKAFQEAWHKERGQAALDGFVTGAVWGVRYREERDMKPTRGEIIHAGRLEMGRRGYETKETNEYCGETAGGGTSPQGSTPTGAGVGADSGGNRSAHQEGDPVWPSVPIGLDF